MSRPRRQPAAALALAGLAAALAGSLAVAGPAPAAQLPLPPPGSSREEALGGGQAHRYAVDLESGQLLSAVLDQRGIDVLFSALDPAGKILLEVDSPLGDEGPEVLLLVAATPGRYTLEVRALAGGAPPGRYSLRCQEPRPPTAEDRRRAAAVALEAAAVRQARRRTPESLEEAAGRYREALAGWRALADRERVAQALYGLGGVLRRLGRGGEALAALAEAAALWRRLGDLGGVAETCNQEGMVQRSRGEVPAARAAFLCAAELWRQLDRPSRQARALNNLGLLEHEAGRLDAARAAYLEALEGFRRAGDRRRQAIALNNLGGVADARGEPVEAIGLYRQARELAAAAGDRREEANAVNNLGVAHQVLGEAWEALELYSRSLATFRELGDGRLAAVLDNLGSLSLALGQPEEAERYLSESLELRRRLEDPRAEGGTLNNLGRTELQLGRPKRAVAHFQRALELRRRAGYPAGEAETLRHLGRLYLDLEEAPRALPPLEEALAIFRSLGDREGEGRVRLDLGRASRAMGEGGAARRELAAALEGLTAAGNRWFEAEAREELARLELAAGRPREALTEAEAALDLIEALRYGAVVAEHRSSLTARYGGAYEVAIEAAMRLDSEEPGAAWAERAFRLAERARGRSFVELLREARLDLGRDVDPRLLASEREIRGRVNALAARLSGGAGEDPEERRRLDELVEAHRQARARIRAASLRAAALSDPSPAAVREIRRLLGPDSALLEYALGEEHSTLWLVTAGGLEAVRLAPRREIEEAVRAAYRRLSSHAPGRDREGDEPLARLGELVLGPAAERLTGRLLVVPDGALHYIPFAALPMPRGEGSPGRDTEPLVARHEVLVLPSASALVELGKARKAAGGGGVLVLADPVFDPGDPRLRAGEPVASTRGAEPGADTTDRAARQVGLESLGRLPWTRREAEAIAAVVPGPLLQLATGFDAELSALTAADLSGVRLLHLATHGLVNSRHPELSGLVLSRFDASGRPRPGFLRLSDVYALDLEADLVVLSGCRTALGRDIRGEGLVGLARGFLHAGARQVMASLWSVEDRGTAELMARFYRGVFTEGLVPAAALASAQRSLRRDRRFADPYFWASFVLLGEGPPGGGARPARRREPPPPHPCPPPAAALHCRERSP